jgi:hypothetical protein
MRNNWKKELINSIETKDIKKAQSLVAPHVPKKLYRYHSISTRTFIGLDKGAVWFSHPSKFNDPYDSSAVFFNDLMQAGWEGEMKKVNTTPFEIKQLKKVIKVQEDKMNADFVAKSRDSLRVCCFTENKDSVLMWSHYADQHKGICVEYDFTSLSADDLRLKWLYPVIYSKIVVNISEFINPENLNPFMFMLASMHKYRAWSYEKEWRMMIANGVMPEEAYKMMPTPTAIYMGSRIDPDVRIYLGEFCYRKKIKLFQSSFERNKFKMVFTEIPLKRSGDKLTSGL